MKALKALALVQLAIYFVLFVLLAWPRTETWGTFHWGDGIKEVLVLMYAAGGVTLIYSAIVFLDFGNKISRERLEQAKLAQKALFIACCAAVIPISFIAMSNLMEYTILVIATVIGLAFFPITLTLVKKVQVIG
jgi:predicted membrane channel-forming protein YqfA (hemolysin III family)